MILLDLVGSTPQGLLGSDEELREYHRLRVDHVTMCAHKYGIERLDDQGDADLLFLSGDDARPLLEFFNDINRRDPVPDYRHFRPVFRMVAHHNRFAFSPRDASGVRRQLSSNHLTLQFRLEKACPERTLLVTRSLYELVRDHIPEGWPQRSEPVPEKLDEWRTIIGRDIYWLGLPGDDLDVRVDRVYAGLGVAVNRAASPGHDRKRKPAHAPDARELRLMSFNRLADLALLAATILALWNGMNDNWFPSLLFPITLCAKGTLILLHLPSDVRVLVFVALIAVIAGLTILVGILAARKELRSAWSAAGCGILGYGLGMATVLMMQSYVWRGGARRN